jgi:signal transduction histidine kinase/CheY-like chemotaxis protein
MPIAQAGPTVPPPAAAQTPWQFFRNWLLQPATEQGGLDGLLRELTRVFTAPAAGVAAWPSGPVIHRRPAAAVARWPWEEDSALPTQALQSPTARTIRYGDGGSLLLTAARSPDGLGWLLWLEHPTRLAWDDDAAVGLALAAQALVRRHPVERSPRWAQQLDRAERQLRLETAAQTAGRLAHDFGNVLTGILGFSELSLAQRPGADAPLFRYLREIHQAAQTGAHLTQQLRQFSRRAAAAVRPCDLKAVVEGELTRLDAAGDRPSVLATLPDDLPRIALDTDHVRVVLAALLDNAREAHSAAGRATVSAQVVDLSPDDCLDAYGDLRPGRHVAITVADAGPGIGAEARRRLFAEPFYSTKPRRGGLGLMVAYGVLHAHHGGLRLRPGTPGGTVAEIFVPVAVPAPAPAVGTPAGDRVLVVDDDPMILQFICNALTHAGYRVQPACDADEAFAAYAAAGPDPFRLVLSDVVMPKASGVELARRLTGRDAAVRILFMTGFAAGDFARHELAGWPFDLLTKPFRAEGLLRAVRTSIDRPANRPAVLAEAAGVS